MAEEKRLNLRTDLKAKLTLKIIETGTQRQMDPFEVEIQDVSAGGIGFYSENQLMIGEIFHGELQIWTKRKMEVILKIVRSKVEAEGYSYGSIFIGMQNNDTLGIKIYQMLNEQ